jgi:hypothetical protein
VREQKRVRVIGDNGMRSRTRVEEAEPGSDVNHTPLVRMYPSIAYIINQPINQPSNRFVLKFAKFIRSLYVYTKGLDLRQKNTGSLDIYLLTVMANYLG